MTTSGTVNIEYNVAEAIEEAFERAGYDVQTLNAGHARSARRSMNLIFAEWANQNIVTWAMDEQSFTTTASAATETLPVGTIEVFDSVLRRSSVDTAMTRIDRTTYHALPNKAAEGRPDRFWVDRQISQPVMYLYLTPENSTDEIVYWRLRRLYDITAGSETADVPWRWTPALITRMALELFMKLPLEKRMPKDYQMIKGASDDAFYLASTEDRNRASTFAVPAYWDL